MMRNRCTVLALAIGLVMGLGCWASVAAATGAIQVTVYAVTPDKTKESVIGATILLQDPSKQFPEQALVTNENGQVIFPVVPPASSYVIVASMPGYTRIPKPGVRVVAGVTTQVTIVLIPEITEEVVVKGREKVVELDQGAESQTSISGEEFQDLPVFGRDYQAVLTLAPGVQDTNGDGNPNVHGSREQDFRMNVDGVANVDPLTGGYQSNVNPDSIEEIEIIDSGADASYGGAVGGFGRIITKSGSNKFEGSFNIFLQDSMFDGNGAGNGDPLDFKRRQPSVYFSGPILRDKLWFSLNHELVQIQEPINLVGGRSFVQDYKELRNADKLTWQVTPKNKLQFEWRSNPAEIEPAGVNTLTPPESGYHAEQKGPTATFKWIAPFSPTFFWEATVGYSNIKLDATPYAPDSKNTCVSDDPNNAWPYLKDYICTDQTLGGRVSGAFPEYYHDLRQRYSYQLDAEQFLERWLGGQHRLKFGLGLDRVRYERDDTISPQLTLRGNGSVNRVSPTGGGTTDAAAFFLDSVAYYFPGQSVITPSNMLRAQHGVDTSLGNYYNAYLNDTYEPRSNLTISVGLRFSREELSSDGYYGFNPAGERATFDSTNRAMIEQCVAELGCQPGNITCYDFCLANSANAAQGLFTIHPLDNPALVTNPPPDAPPDWTPGPNDIPNCTEAPNYLLCESLHVTQWDNALVPNGQLRLRNTETFSIISSSLAPRLSVSWDPKNDGKTRVSASWGRYYGDTFLQPLVDENGPDRVVQSYAMSTNFYPSDPNRGPTPVSLFPSAFSVTMIDRDLKQQRNDEWSIGAEREIAAETAVKVRYVNRKYTDQLQARDINHRPITYDEMKNRPIDIYNIPNPNPPYGRLDCPLVRGYYDCTGYYSRELNSTGGPGQNAPSDKNDGLPDLVVLNPFFASVYYVSNFNYTNYEAYILELQRRYFQNWEMNLSYTYSKTYGQAEQYSSGLGQDPTIADQEAGPLSIDQPHVFKLSGRMFVPRFGGFRVGGAVSYQSGLPYSVTETRPVLDFPTDLTSGEGAELGDPNPINRRFITYRTIYPSGHRNDHRNAAYWNVDVNFQKEFMIKNVKTSLQFEVYNLLNDDTERIYYIDHILVTYNTNHVPLYQDSKVADRRFGRRFQLALKMNF